MTPEQAVILTAYVKACCPQQPIGEYTPDAWGDLLADLRLDDCRDAVTEISKRQTFVSAADIRAEVRRIRDRRLAATPDPAPPREALDNWPEYQKHLRVSAKRIADGKPELRAIGGDR